MNFLAITTVLLSLIVLTIGTTPTSAADGQTFECSDPVTPLTGKWGYLKINKGGKCGFRSNSGFIAISTVNLTLDQKDYIKLVTASSTSGNERNIPGPIQADYIAIGMQQPEIAFFYDAKDDSTILARFVQEDPVFSSESLGTGNSGNIVIQSIQVAEYKLQVPANLYVTTLGGSETFGHYLNQTSISIKNSQPTVDQFVKIRMSPVLPECSKNFIDTTETVHELAGPADISKVGHEYKCVNVFRSNLNSKEAHYDVSFANFMDISDNNDKLTISDGSSTLEITKLVAETYYQRKPAVSFKGPNLVVIYENPQITKKTFVSKLTVNSVASGGVIDGYGTLPLPAKGQARYALRSSDDSDSALTIKGDFKGASIGIFGSSSVNNAITLKEGMFLPPEIVLPKSGQHYSVEVRDVKSKLGWSLEYKKSNSGCGSILFGNAGTLELSGGNKTCYWLVGASATLNIVRNDLSDPKSCLEIFSLAQQAPIFSKCSISPTEVLPPFIVGPAYVKVTTAASSMNYFKANVIEPATGFVTSTSGLNTAGYPVSYPWCSTTDTQQFNATGKSIILSVNDLDLREGEKLVIDSKEIKSSKSDIDISNKTVKIEVQRSGATRDYKLHRGVALVASQFQKIIVADPKQSKIVTPANITNLLISVPVVPKARFSFNMSGNFDKSTQVSVFDSQSLMGRQVVLDNSTATFMAGSTTSNTLLVRYSTSGKTLPEMTLRYSQIPCNATSDHVCDNDSRCIPADKMCKGKAYCQDGTDLTVACSSGPAPPPKVVHSGLSGVAVFFLSILMLALGSLATLYGPDLFKTLENRFRSGQYTTFSSTE